MKILVDLDSLTPPVTGVGHYTHQIGKRLLQHSSVDSLAATMYGSELTASQIEALFNPDIQRQQGPGLNGPSSTPPGYTMMQKLRPLLKDMPAARLIWNRWKAYRHSRTQKELQQYIYWEPNFLLKPFSGPSALTIHDLSFIAHPEFHPESRLREMDARFGPSVEKASHLIVVSRFTFEAVRTQLAVPASRMSIVPPAAGHEFQPISAEDAARTRQRLGLPEKYILSVGTLEPRKNLSRLLSAYEDLPDQLRHEWPLVCVGGKGWNDTDLNADVHRLEQRGELIRLGYVAQSELPLITASAGLMAYISVYEGFGMPVAEAMACGVPVMTSHGTSMEEVAGEHAFYVDPYDIVNIRDVLHEALESEQKRHELAEAGPAQARRYSWDGSTEALVKALKPLAGTA